MITQMGISHRVFPLQGAAHTDYLLSQSQLCPAPPSNSSAIHTSSTTGFLANNPHGFSQLRANGRSKIHFLFLLNYWTQYIPLDILHLFNNQAFRSFSKIFFLLSQKWGQKKRPGNQDYTGEVAMNVLIWHWLQFSKPRVGFLLSFSHYKAFKWRQQKLKWSIHVYTAALMQQSRFMSLLLWTKL